MRFKLMERRHLFLFSTPDRGMVRILARLVLHDLLPLVLVLMEPVRSVRLRSPTGLVVLLVRVLFAHVCCRLRRRCQSWLPVASCQMERRLPAGRSAGILPAAWKAAVRPA